MSDILSRPGCVQEHLLWNCSQVNYKDLFWRNVVIFGFGNGLVQSSNKPLPEFNSNPDVYRQMTPLAPSQLQMRQYLSIDALASRNAYLILNT